MSRFLLPVLAMSLPCFLAAEKGGGGGGPEKPPSLDAQLTAAQGRIAEFEQQAGAWNTERQTLTQERDTALGRVTDLEGKLTKADGDSVAAQALVTEMEGQLATANGQIKTLTAERDDARALAANPSAQARTVLAAAGAPAVITRTDGKNHPAASKTDVSGLSGLEKAIALHQAATSEK